MTNLLTYESDKVVSTITLDDGKANVMSIRMLRDLNTALDRAQAEKTVVVIAGRPGMFSAGFDLAVFQQDRQQQIEMLIAGARTTERLLAFPAPVVIACTGHAVAMGIFILLGGDVRIGPTDNTAKFCVNEVQIGMTLPRFAIETCRQRLMPAHFSRAPITATPYNAQEAMAAGFLDELVTAKQVIETAKTRALALSKLVREAHVATKLRVRSHALELLRRGIDLDIEEWSARA